MPLDPRWEAFAQSDLEAARVLFTEGISNQVCFHSQQCAEKLLKGSLPQENRPRSHKITDLVRLTEFLNFDEPLMQKLRLLDRFYIPSRYPDALPGSLEDGMPSESDAKESLETAEELSKVLHSR